MHRHGNSTLWWRCWRRPKSSGVSLLINDYLYTVTTVACARGVLSSITNARLFEIWEKHMVAFSPKAKCRHFLWHHQRTWTCMTFPFETRVRNNYLASPVIKEGYFFSFTFRVLNVLLQNLADFVDPILWAICIKATLYSMLSFQGWWRQCTRSYLEGDCGRQRYSVTA
jgi:hypothetical protein